MSQDTPAGEIVKWYTLARRFPQVIGRTSDGAKIPGGPYTYTQVCVGVGLLVGGLKTTGLWAHFGTVYNGMLLVLVTAGIVAGLGRLPLANRSPLAMAQGAYRVVAASASGTIAGRPVGLARPARSLARVMVQVPTPKPGPATATEPASVAEEVDEAEPVTVGSVAPNEARPLSTSQRLLAAQA